MLAATRRSRSQARTTAARPDARGHLKNRRRRWGGHENGEFLSQRRRKSSSNRRIGAAPTTGSKHFISPQRAHASRPTLPLVRASPEVPRPANGHPQRRTDGAVINVSGRPLRRATAGGRGGDLPSVTLKHTRPRLRGDPIFQSSPRSPHDSGCEVDVVRSPNRSASRWKHRRTCGVSARRRERAFHILPSPATVLLRGHPSGSHRTPTPHRRPRFALRGRPPPNDDAGRPRPGGGRPGGGRRRRASGVPPEAPPPDIDPVGPPRPAARRRHLDRGHHGRPPPARPVRAPRGGTGRGSGAARRLGRRPRLALRAEDRRTRAGASQDFSSKLLAAIARGYVFTVEGRSRTSTPVLRADRFTRDELIGSTRPYPFWPPATSITSPRSPGHRQRRIRRGRARADHQGGDRFPVSHRPVATHPDGTVNGHITTITEPDAVQGAKTPWSRRPAVTPADLYNLRTIRAAPDPPPGGRRGGGGDLTTSRWSMTRSATPRGPVIVTSPVHDRTLRGKTGPDDSAERIHHRHPRRRERGRSVIRPSGPPGRHHAADHVLGRDRRSTEGAHPDAPSPSPTQPVPCEHNVRDRTETSDPILAHRG